MKKLTLNKINFAGATELTREQLKKVMGGDGYGTTEGGGTMPGTEDASDPDANVKACEGKSEGASCSYSGKSGTCVKGTWTSLYCNIPPNGN